MNKQFEIAYFSAEIGISSSIPTYSGGLGVLAGDHIKAAGDAGINMCAITLLYKEGYFKQRIDEDGIQTETYPRFDPEPLINQMDLQFSLQLQKREVFVQVFRFNYIANSGHNIPIYFLDTDLEKNIEEDRNITHRLYSGDKDHRILQEAILGFGGTKLLECLSQKKIKTYHMNEGHCSFLVLDLLKKYCTTYVTYLKLQFQKLLKKANVIPEKAVDNIFNRMKTLERDEIVDGPIPLESARVEMSMFRAEMMLARLLQLL